MSLGRVALCAVVAVLASYVGPASAATQTAIAEWGPFEGDAGDYRTTMQLVGTGYPQADMASDSRAGQVGVQSGASTWFGATTPPGERYGSSRDLPYLNLRPRVDNAGSPSVTTYTFERPTPLGWAFVLGDIDADEVTVTATLADDSPASVADLGFQGAFSLCDPAPRPSGCPGAVPGDVPTWDPATATLRGNDGAVDTFGAAGWFEPQVPLASLTFTFRWRSGFPVYQTWFASRTQDVTGTVALLDGTCAVDEMVLRLLAADGTVLDSTSPAGDGSYAFAGVAATDDFTVEIVPGSSDCSVIGPDTASLDLTGDDDTADFQVRGPQQVTADVAGEVTEDGSGDGVGDATIDLTGPTGDDEATTGPDGSYGFDDLPPGDYTLELTPPDGYDAVGPASSDVTVTPNGEVVGDTDFVVAVADEPTPIPTEPPTDQPDPPADQPDDDPGATLPDTGGPPTGWLVLGLGLLGAGMITLLAGRRIGRIGA